MDFLEILEEVQKSKKPKKTFPYVATEYLEVSRRGWKVVEAVNKMLEDHDLLCEPNFGSAWYYGEIEIKPKPKVTAGRAINSNEETDPTPRLNLLKAANLTKIKESGKGNGLISVSKDTLISKATTLMILHDFSQLPILSGERDVEGVVSWKSIGRALALGKHCVTVSDCKEEVTVLNYDEPLFRAVKFVLDNDFVLVRQKDKTISGIVTATDIGEQFIAMAEPFLIIEQIENHIRTILDQKFGAEELISNEGAFANPKEINSLADLTFGQYVRIFQDPKKFEKLNINIDRATIVKQLDEVRNIRNDVMHFNPDGITDKGLEVLRQTVSFLHTIGLATRNPNKK